MLEFFRGWKRKAGSVTLALACVFTIGWMRSVTVHDGFDLPVGNVAAIGILSANRQTGLYVTTDDAAYHMAKRPAWTEYMPETFEAMFPARLGFVWSWRFNEFAMIRHSSGHVSVWVCPYWFIVFSLTVLSAWLLMSKRPGKTKPPIPLDSEKP